MEGPGSEASKRQRLDSYNVSHRLQQQPPTAQSHGYSGHTLPPPNSYVQPPPIPQSPYHEAPPHEHRNLPDPIPHGYSHSHSHSHSGHNTPIRDSRSYPSDPGYSRRGSASGATRSPDEYPQYATARNLSSTSSEAPHFPPQHLEHAVHLSGYPPHDGPMNGNTHHGLPMSNYNEPSYHAQGHASEYSQSPVNTGPHAYGGPGYNASPGYHLNMPRPKKGNRAQQACDVCRAKKAKCDEQRPECGTCREARVTCNYQTVVPAKADRANQAILDQLAVQKRDMQTANETMEGRLERIEQILSNMSSAKPATGFGLQSPDIKLVPRHSNTVESPKRRTTADQKTAPHVLSQQTRTRDQRTVDTSPSGSHITTSTDSTGGDISMLRDNGPGIIPEFPIAIEHSTAAHRLLRWPSISALVKQSRLMRQVRDDYVMEHEEKKGVLRVYGRGEGKDYLDGGQPGAASPATSSTSGRSEDTTEARSPASPPEGLWGTELDSLKTTQSRSTNEVGGLTPDGYLKLDPKTLYGLLQSYLSNIHILHPFLDKGRLTRMVERFSLRYNPSEQTLTKLLFSGPATSAITFERPREPSMVSHRVGKRKLSDSHTRAFVQEPGSIPHPPSPKTTPEKSPANAIVLLVMALGKICEGKEDLRGPVPESSGDTPVPPFRNLTSSRTQTDSPPPMSLGQSPTSSLPPGPNMSTPSPIPGTRLTNFSPRSSTDEASGSSAQRNIDVIPGLAYYAKATDILGNVHGSVELANVQANLLAGLYAGQLARSFESWSWIHSACRTCRYLVRDPTLSKEHDLPRRDLIKFAFWTCSQLEGDILAELDLPRSGIQDIELDYPKGFSELADFEHVDNQGYNVPGAVQKMMSYYSFQIHIRNSLNSMQKDLHPPENRERKTDFFNMRNIHHESLQNWRNVLPPWLRWNDEDEPATDINDARLRAKYYGALYIIHRPFLRHVLDREMIPQGTDSPQSDVLKTALHKPLAFAAQSHERSRAAMPPPRSASAETNIEAEILHSAKICVKAAMRSTVAFDNILPHQRLVVTNIFGTAHAQFGNMLVLAATYKSKLRHLVPADQLEHLFDRTIRFLRRLRPISSTLAQDALILESLREVIFEPQNASFSSVDN